MMYKTCKSIDYQSSEWQNYLAWRKMPFTSFESADSSLNQFNFVPLENDDWKHIVTIENFLTDLVTDLDHAMWYAKKHDFDTLIELDFVEQEDPQRNKLGYDILDGDYSYSLLTNFGNDIEIVNENLSRNALVPDKNAALKVHEWFLENMPTDPHVQGSRIFTIYRKISVS